MTLHRRAGYYHRTPGRDDGGVPFKSVFKTSVEVYSRSLLLLYGLFQAESCIDCSAQDSDHAADQEAVMEKLPSSSQPITGSGESELVIRALYEIAGEYDKGFDHQIVRILELGLKRFDLDIGILSNIPDSVYTVVKQVSPTDVPLHDGDVFQLGNTYCSITLAANGPVGFEHIAQTEVSTHPAYESFGLEAYIGVPVYVKGEVYGTLNFSSPKPRPRVFSEVDIDALQLMAAWVGSELSRRQTEEELKQAMGKLERQSREDPLTHLYNRRGFEEKLVRLTRRSKFHGSDLIGMVVDIDDFKVVNDTHGHSIGDQVLETVAESISNSVRPNDI